MGCRARPFPAGVAGRPPFNGAPLHNPLSLLPHPPRPACAAQSLPCRCCCQPWRRASPLPTGASDSPLWSCSATFCSRCAPRSACPAHLGRPPATGSGSSQAACRAVGRRAAKKERCTTAQGCARRDLRAKTKTAMLVAHSAHAQHVEGPPPRPHNPSRPTPTCTAGGGHHGAHPAGPSQRGGGGHLGGGARQGHRGRARPAEVSRTLPARPGRPCACVPPCVPPSASVWGGAS